MGNERKESLGQKIGLMLFDKLLLAAMAAIFVGQIQDDFKSQATLRDQAYAVSRIHTDLLVEHRKRLTAVIDRYLPILDYAKSVGQITDSDRIDTLNELLQEVRVVDTTVSAILPDLSLNTDALVKSVSYINLSLISSRQRLSDIEAKEDELLCVYTVLLEAFRKETRSVVEREYGGLSEVETGE